MMRQIYIIWLLVTCGHWALAQQTPPLVSVKFERATVQSFVTTLESAANYHFYYDPVTMDSLRITLTVTKKTVPEILALALNESGYHYLVNGESVFLTKTQALEGELAAGWFGIQPKLNKTSGNTTQKIPGFITDDSEKKITEAK